MQSIRRKLKALNAKARLTACGLALCVGGCADLGGAFGGLAIWQQIQQEIIISGIVADSSAGFTYSSQDTLITSETGTTSSFTLVLNTEPVFDVTVTVVSSNTDEGSVSPSTLTFTNLNWNVPQTVTVTGQDELIADGNQSYTIDLGSSVSLDPNYSFKSVGTVSALNTDDENPGVTIVATNNPLATTEAGAADTFRVVLNTQPTGTALFDTTVDGTEGSASPAQVMFTSSNWNVPQTVTITGVDDSVADGTINYNASFAFNVGSTDPNYNSGFAVTDTVAVENTDNDTPGITLSATSGLVTTEAGGNDTFTVVLDSEPTANVVIGTIASSNTAEGTVAPANLTFTTANWNVPQTVTVTGVDDFVKDGAQAYTITLTGVTSTDGNYNGMSVSSVSVSNSDNDNQGITVTPTTGKVTTEAGGNDTFTVVLDSEPTANVVIPIVSSNTSEGTVSPASLTFTNANWNTPQTVTITGVDDATPVVDGNIAYTVEVQAATSTDPLYNGLDATDVSATNNDNDTAAFIVTPAARLVTSEVGSTTTFQVRLQTQPTANVTLSTITSLDTGEGTVSPSSLTFTTANWNTNQTVTITGVADAATDGNVDFSIDLGAGTSTDGNYNGLAPPDSNGGTAGDLTANNCDVVAANRLGTCMMPGVTALTTTEAGGTAVIGLVLEQLPTGNVDFNIASTDTTEVTSGTAAVTFTTGNWNQIQWVTLTGVNDFIDDGNQTVVGAIDLQAMVSGDGFYSGNDPANLTVTNNDNDTFGFTVSAISGNTTELGGVATFTIRLNTRPDPANTVQINLTSTDTGEGTVSPASVTFTSSGGGGCGGDGNWCTNQTITVTGVNDSIVDGNIGFTITTSAAISGDANYSGANPADRAVTNVDNDRYVFISSTMHDGDFDNDATYNGGVNAAVNADGNGIPEADNFCMTGANGYPGSGTYKAMLVDGTNRTIGADWVFTANYEYYRQSTTTRIFTANGAGIFVFGTLDNSFGTTSDYFTGLTAAWGNSTNDCSNWGSTAGNGAQGDISATDSNSINTGTLACNTAHRIVCVQQ